MALITTYLEGALSPSMLTAAVYCMLGFLCYCVVVRRKDKTILDLGLPWVALDEEGLRDADTARMQFMTSCRELLEKGLKTVRAPR